MSIDGTLNDQLAATRAQVRDFEKLEGRLAAARAEAADQRNRLSFLEARLAREERDVRRFESMSLVAVLHYFLGDIEQRTRREKQEAAAAALKCTECRASLVKVEQEIAELEKQRESFADPRSHWNELMQQKESAIRLAGDENARRIYDIEQSMADAKSDMKELAEAIFAGNEARSRVDSAYDHLETARGWGTFDMLGGGLMTTAIKHARIDQARQEVHRAQQALARFNRELTDVKARLDADGSLEIGGLATFADYFFDGLIADWIVQSRINRSLAAVGDLRDKIRVLLERLDRRREAARRALDRLKEEKLRVIETA
ncbi:hypothetical protein LLG95_05940 [bacterium]|nr:hypothetical protein [bacterium]